jgi:hypothetical protein
MWVKEGYQTVVVSQRGLVMINNMKAKVDLEKEVEALRISVRLLMARIEKLEGGAKNMGGPKRKAEDPSDQPQKSKKVKPEEMGKGKDKEKARKSA